MQVTSSSEHRHRRDIDGLRAIAVLGVVVFHIDQQFMPGGYLGVDMFFVISGYLITGNIIRAVDAGQWSFWDFYSQRVMRLFPALFVTIALSLVAGGILLTPHLLIELGHSAQSAVLWYSNILFWLQSDYFATAAEFKPLLHTWSLSVEEQFYLFWPALLVGLSALNSKRWMLIGVLAVTLISVIGAEIWGRDDSALVFYLTPFRIFEFGLGAVMVWARRWPPLHFSLREPLMLAGIAVLVASFFLVKGKTAPVGLFSLIPCTATAILLLNGDRSPVMGRIIANPPGHWIGRISYSVYLVHWPLIVYYEYFTVTDPKDIIGVGLLIASIVLGAVLYATVEQPFLKIRKGGGDFARKSALPVGLGAALIVFGLSSPLIIGDGWPARFPEGMETIARFDVKAERRGSWQYVEQFDWSNYQDEAFDILVVGDSHAKDFFNSVYTKRAAIGAQYGAFDIRAWSTNQQCERGDNPDMACIAGYSEMFELGLHKHASVIVIAQAWSPGELEALRQVVQRIRRNSNARVVLVNNTVEFKDVPSLLVRRYWAGPPGTWIGDMRERQYQTVNVQLAGIAEALNVPVIDRAGSVCQNGRCVVSDSDSIPYLYDGAHWTLDGARYYGQRMLDQGSLDVLFNPPTGGD